MFRAPEAPAAREARASLRSAPRLEARPCPPDPPAPFTPVGPGRLMCACASSRSPARPRRRPRAPQPGPPDPLAPSTPVGPCRLVVPGASACCPAQPYRRPWAPQPGRAARALRSLWHPPIPPIDRCWVENRPKRRPLRRKWVNLGCFGRGGLRFGHMVVVSRTRGWCGTMPIPLIGCGQP